ncbi:helix-turn-helix domain-containing protein [Candidatus Woesearchaeota archaeon]|nr:helix-turn-helix domain-containing protein [Candidatus Woesearchaeota archaeon]
MALHMPQEVEVWYLLPALRRELARVFVDEEGLSQKEAAELLGLTQAAVSQYLHTKRGSDLKFTKQELTDIRAEAKGIRKNPNSIMQSLNDLCRRMMGGKTMCDLHRRLDGTIPATCSVCKVAA